MPTFVSELVVDIAANCTSLDLTGPMYIQGADVDTGVFQFSDASTRGNHLNWVNGEPDKGAITNADVTALPTSDGKLKIRFAKTPLKGEALAGGVEVQGLTANGNQVTINVGYHLLNYGGQPTAADLVRTAEVGETVTITESELRANATYFSNSAPEILVTELPADVVETEVNGERVFTYIAAEEGAEARFSFAATEEQAPAGLIQSEPAQALIQVLAADDDPVVPTPPAEAEPPRFRADTGLDYPATDEVQVLAVAPYTPGEVIFVGALIAGQTVALVAGILTLVFRKRWLARRAAAKTGASL